MNDMADTWRKSFLRRVPALVCAAVTVACGVEEGAGYGDLTTEQANLVQAAVLETREAVDRAVEAGALTLLTDQPVYASRTRETTMVWATHDCADAYLALNTSNKGEEQSRLQPGCLILRETLDRRGDVKSFSVALRPEGRRGWLLTAFDANGELLLDDWGQPYAGPESACASCHSSDGEAVLFGLPASF